MTTRDFKTKIFSYSERLYPMVARMLGNNADAEDAIQEIMIKLWNRRHQVSEHPNPGGFVFLTARNYCLDILKSKKRQIKIADFKMQNQASNAGYEQLELKELILSIEKILKDLPKQKRDILIMRDIDGLHYKEIATITQLTIGHVRVILSRTRKYVQEQLKKNYSYE